MTENQFEKFVELRKEFKEKINFRVFFGKIKKMSLFKFK